MLTQFQNVFSVLSQPPLNHRKVHLYHHSYSRRHRSMYSFVCWSGFESYLRRTEYCLGALLPVSQIWQRRGRPCPPSVIAAPLTPSVEVTTLSTSTRSISDEFQKHPRTINLKRYKDVVQPKNVQRYTHILPT
jgi:hypothetical protein